MKPHNPNCDGMQCIESEGETRVYPLGGGGNLILCSHCFYLENRYRAERAKETDMPDAWPIVYWQDAKIYLGEEAMTTEHNQIADWVSNMASGDNGELA